MEDILPVLNRFRRIYSAYGQKYDIHFCGTDEIGDVMLFLEEHWKHGHILAHDRSMMDWQYYDRLNDRYNFTIAKDRESGELHAVGGFIPSSLYDDAIETPIVWGAIVKVREDIRAPGLSICLSIYWKDHLRLETIAGLGMSQDAINIDTHMGYECGLTDQFFIMNPHCRKPRLTSGTERFIHKSRDFFDESSAALVACPA